MLAHKYSPLSSAIQKTFPALLLILVILGLFRLAVPALEGFLVVDRTLPHADALVVMAGEKPIRIPAAARLYKQGKAEKILLTNDGIFSSWSQEKQRNLYEVEWAEESLLKMKVPKSAIVKLPYSASGSIYDALNTRAFVLEKGIKSICIVTSDYHSKRSLWTFERVFRGCPIVIGVHPVKSGVTALAGYRKVTPLGLEFLKYLYYRCKFL